MYSCFRQKRSKQLYSLDDVATGVIYDIRHEPISDQLFLAWLVHMCGTIQTDMAMYGDSDHSVLRT